MHYLFCVFFTVHTFRFPIFSAPQLCCNPRAIRPRWLIYVCTYYSGFLNKSRVRCMTSIVIVRTQTECACASKTVYSNLCDFIQWWPVKSFQMHLHEDMNSGVHIIREGLQCIDGRSVMVMFLISILVMFTLWYSVLSFLLYVSQFTKSLSRIYREVRWRHTSYVYTKYINAGLLIAAVKRSTIYQVMCEVRMLHFILTPVCIVCTRIWIEHGEYVWNDTLILFWYLSLSINTLESSYSSSPA